ncbi:MAG: PPOX class F420-dependent oxidoreductase [Caldilineaceae bacterium]|nr:PPOX class F420-dependent oxidoreductase [Caldilineaceae bacterium]
MKLSDLGDPKYISLETIRKNGQGVRTPVWTVAREGKLLVWTQGDSWKVKRARNNPLVRVAACDMRGNTEGPWVEGVVTSIADDVEVKQEMRRALRKKYRAQVLFVTLVAALRGENKGQVVMEIGDRDR